MRKTKDFFSRGFAPLFRLKYKNKVSYLFGSCNNISLGEIYHPTFQKFLMKKEDGPLIEELLSHKALAVESKIKNIGSLEGISIQVIDEIIDNPTLFSRNSSDPPLSILINRSGEATDGVIKLMDCIQSIIDMKMYGFIDMDVFKSDLLNYFNNKTFSIESLLKFSNIDDFNYLLLQRITRYMGMDYNLMNLYWRKPIFSIYEPINPDYSEGYQRIYDRRYHNAIDYFSFQYNKFLDRDSITNGYLSFVDKYSVDKIFEGIQKYHRGDQCYKDIDDILFVVRYERLIEGTYNKGLFRYFKSTSYDVEIYSTETHTFVPM